MDKQKELPLVIQILIAFYPFAALGTVIFACYKIMGWAF